MRGLWLALAMMVLVACAETSGYIKPPRGAEDPQGTPQFRTATGSYTMDPVVMAEAFLRTSPLVAGAIGVPTGIERSDPASPGEARQFAEAGRATYHFRITGGRGSAVVEVVLQMKAGEWYLASWGMNEMVYPGGEPGVRTSSEPEALAIESAATNWHCFEQVGPIDSISIFGQGDGSLMGGAKLNRLHDNRMPGDPGFDPANYRSYYLMVQGAGKRMVTNIVLRRTGESWTLDGWEMNPSVPPVLQVDIPLPTPPSP